LIATTQAILASDLQGIQSFKYLTFTATTTSPEWSSCHCTCHWFPDALLQRRHTSLQLKEMTTLIQRMIQVDTRSPVHW
jgi:hypothetical protein